jgi:hypothetical protein
MKRVTPNHKAIFNEYVEFQWDQHQKNLIAQPLKEEIKMFPRTYQWTMHQITKLTN